MGRLESASFHDPERGDEVAALPGAHFQMAASLSKTASVISHPSSFPQTPSTKRVGKSEE